VGKNSAILLFELNLSSFSFQKFYFALLPFVALGLQSGDSSTNYLEVVFAVSLTAYLIVQQMAAAAQFVVDMVHRAFEA
jgi:hypothetical protein